MLARGELPRGDGDSDFRFRVSNGVIYCRRWKRSENPACDHDRHSAAWGREMTSFLQDLRVALRQLMRNPGFALTAVLSLALGVGATVSVLLVVYVATVHPFPYADVDPLANLSVRDARGDIFDEWFLGQQLQQDARVHAFQRIASWNAYDMAVTE